MKLEYKKCQWNNWTYLFRKQMRCGQYSWRNIWDYLCQYWAGVGKMRWSLVDMFSPPSLWPKKWQVCIMTWGLWGWCRCCVSSSTDRTPRRGCPAQTMQCTNNASSLKIKLPNARKKYISHILEINCGFLTSVLLRLRICVEAICLCQETIWKP